MVLAAPRSRCSAAVSRPSPQPRSATRGDATGSSSARRSQKGCSRSAANRLYCSGSHCGVGVEAAVCSSPGMRVAAPPFAPSASRRRHTPFPRMPLLFCDLDNTLIDRAAAYRAWAEDYAARMGRDPRRSSGW